MDAMQLKEHGKKFLNSPAIRTIFQCEGKVGTVLDHTQNANPFFPNILFWVTERGSTYIPLSNGQTIRYKHTTQNMEKPMDLVVFVPDEYWVKQNAPQNVIKFFSDESGILLYQDILLEYIRGGNGKTVYISDAKGGPPIRTNKDLHVHKNNNYYLCLCSGKGNGNIKVDQTIPIKIDPEIGYQVFDMGKEGETTTRHLGHRIIGIQQRS